MSCTRDSAIHTYSLSTGAHVAAIGGGRGGAPGQLAFRIGGLCFTDGATLLVAESYNDRGQEFRLSDGAHVRCLGVGHLRSPEGVACGGDVLAFSEAAPHFARVSLLQRATGAPLRVFGSYGTGTGQLQNPCGVRIAADGGSVLVADVDRGGFTRFAIGDADNGGVGATTTLFVSRTVKGARHVVMTRHALNGDGRGVERDAGLPTATDVALHTPTSLECGERCGEVTATGSSGFSTVSTVTVEGAGTTPSLLPPRLESESESESPCDALGPCFDVSEGDTPGSVVVVGWTSHRVTQLTPIRTPCSSTANSSQHPHVPSESDSDPRHDGSTGTSCHHPAHSLVTSGSLRACSDSTVVADSSSEAGSARNRDSESDMESVGHASAVTRSTPPQCDGTYTVEGALGSADASASSVPGQFTFPCAVAVLAGGRLVVREAGNAGRIQVFRSLQLRMAWIQACCPVR